MQVTHKQLIIYERNGQNVKVVYLGSGSDREHKSGHSGTAEVQQTALEERKRGGTRG